MSTSRWAAGGGLSRADADVIYQQVGESGYDLVMLLGQSNMSGRGTAYDARTDPADDRIYQYGATGTYNGVLAQAFEPLAMHDVPSGIGPGLQFARWYAGTIPSARRVLLVPAAHGGTPLSSTATLAWRRGVAGNLYAQALAQTQAALAAAGPGSRVVAALWVQGETDGDNNTAAATYQTDLDALIAGLRTDLGIPTLPFVIGQMVPAYLSTGTRQAINAVQAATPSRLARVAFAPSALASTNADGNHFAAPGFRLNGRALFDAYRRVITGTADPALPAAPAAVTNLVASIRTTTSLTFTWTASAGAGSYLLAFRPAGGSFSEVGVITGTTYTRTGLSASTAYELRVTPVSNGGPGTESVLGASTTATASTIATDSFNRADNATTVGAADSGQTWIVLAGTWGILSNRAYCPTGASLGGIVLETNAADCTVQTTFAQRTTSGSAHNRLIFRSSDAANFLFVQLRTTTGQYQCYKVVAGSLTQVGTDLGAGNSGDVVAVTLSGSSIVVKVNGTTLATLTDTHNQTATRHGIGSGAGSSSVAFDDFQVISA